MKLELVQAKRMYADNKSIDEIASALNKSRGTVYRWIKEHKEEFEEARKLKELSVDDMGEILDEAHKKMSWKKWIKEESKRKRLIKKKKMEELYL